MKQNFTGKISPAYHVISQLYSIVDLSVRSTIHCVWLLTSMLWFLLKLGILDFWEHETTTTTGILDFWEHETTTTTKKVSKMTIGEYYYSKYRI